MKTYNNRRRIYICQIDESGQSRATRRLMEAVLAGMVRFASSELAIASRRGRTATAQAGGTPFRAPIGYRNVWTRDGSRVVRTVEPDDTRAPLVRWGFEAYATGDWTLRQLRAELADQGLRTRGTKDSPGHPLGMTELGKLLQNRYYIGTLRWRGQEYEGQHEPLIDIETFERVQAVLEQHCRDSSGHQPTAHPRVASVNGRRG